MKKIKILFAFTLLFMLFGTANASTIDKIEAIDNNTIKLTASNDVIFSDVNVEGDIKVLKDIPVSFSAKDTENTKKIVVNLGTDLTVNTSYSLISILGTNGNIDFNIGEYLLGEIANSDFIDGEDGIEKINVIDSRTIELYFSTNLIKDVFEFKILSDIVTNGLISPGNNELNIEIYKNLEKSTSYIVMILNLKDSMGNELSFTEDLYDLLTPEELLEDVTEEEVVIATVKEEEKIIEEGNLEEVALNSAETPDTGTSTSILILLAIIANLAFFFRKKIIK